MMRVCDPSVGAGRAAFRRPEPGAPGAPETVCMLLAPWDGVRPFDRDLFGSPATIQEGKSACCTWQRSAWIVQFIR